MHEQGSQFIINELRKSLTEREYGISAKKITSGNPTYNATFERIHSVLGNLVQAYNIKDTHIEEDETWTGILEATYFVIISKKKG